MSWFYNDIEIKEPNGFGFVYMIINLNNNKKYIGKKQFFFKKTKTVKGKKVKCNIESDWKSYYGSSDILNEDVNTLGKDNFKRVILRICKNKSECSYWEAKFQMDHDVLNKPDEFYNEWITLKVSRSQLIGKKHLTKPKKYDSI